MPWNLPDTVDALRAQIEALRAKNQAVLAEFLSTEIELGFTLLQTAKIEADSDRDHARSALTVAKEALSSLRRFENRIEDPTASADLQSRADQLESAIAAFSRIYFRLG